MPENFNNLDSREKKNLFDALGAAQSATGNFVNATGDDMTGLLTVPTLVSSGMATLTSANIPTLLSSSATLNALSVRPVANLAGATTSPLNIVASTASQAFISFSGVFISSASYGGVGLPAFIIPVYHESQRLWGYVSAQRAIV